MKRPDMASLDRFAPARNHLVRGEFKEGYDSLQASIDRNHEWALLFAMAAWRLGEFHNSLQAAEAALLGYRDIGDSDGEMRANNVAAAGHFALGQLFEARTGFDRAAFLAKERRDIMMAARCANNIGNVDYYLGDNRSALRHYARAAIAFVQVGAIHGIAEANHNRGVVLREEADLLEAKKASNLALSAAQQLNNTRAVGWALSGRAETDALLGDLRLAEAEAKKASTLASNTGDRLTEVDAMRVLGMIARRSGDLAGAIETCQAAAAASEELGNPWMVTKVQIELARAHDEAGAPGRANAALKKTIPLFVEMGATVRAKEIRQQIKSRA
jgi:tetratricopeptide (TPR) repeat protein